MYLSQLVVNVRSKSAHKDLADRYELHRTLMRAFPVDLPSDERLLYRVEDQRPAQTVTLLVQSLYEPAWSNVERFHQRDYLCAEPLIREIRPDVPQGAVLPFRLQANPTVKREGKRHALYTDEALTNWLARKCTAHGFEIDLDRLHIVKLGKRFGKKRTQTWHAVQFDGVLQVTDRIRFHHTLINGIGSGKAFGFGLLSIPYQNTTSHK